MVEGLSFEQEVERLARGRTLNEVDQAAVEAVAGLVLRVRDAQRVIAAEGITIEDQNRVLKEHPAVAVERRASAELRGWMKDRPDLFGEQKVDTRQPRRKFEGFKAV